MKILSNGSNDETVHSPKAKIEIQQFSSEKTIMPNKKMLSRDLEMAKTYNSGDSLVVTDPTTNPPLTSLTMGERTGSRIFW
jgi:hypothetical protein